MSSSNLDILAYEPSPLGMICLRQRELLSEPGTVVTEITLDHQFLMSSYNTASERALARYALEMHQGRDLKVLVGGLGLGYTAREVLSSDRVAQTEVVEFLPPLIDWLGKGLVPLADELRADSRFTVVEGDVYAMLSVSPQRKYDLILVDVDHSPDERLGDGNDAFYTRRGIGAGQGSISRPRVCSASGPTPDSSQFADALRTVFGEVRIESVTFENRVVGEEETNWLFFARG